MKKILAAVAALLLASGVVLAITGTWSEYQFMRVSMLQLRVGDATPTTATGDNDAFVEGDFEVDGDFVTGTTTVHAASLIAKSRGWFNVCGDAVTVNNNTVYYGPSKVLLSSATAGDITCNTTAAGNVTEATADEPALTDVAFYPLGMVCYTDDLGATVTFTLRSAAAAVTPALSVSVADNDTSGETSVAVTTAIAAGATVAVAVFSTADIGVALEFICRVSYAF